MKRINRAPSDSFTSALEAIHHLLGEGFAKLETVAWTEALAAHAEIQQMHLRQKTGPFYRHLVPLRRWMVELLAESYRRYFKLALARPSQIGGDPDEWARTQLQPPARAALEWIHEWYILACDGENQSVRDAGTAEFVPAQSGSLTIQTTISPFPTPTSWRAPAWLFGISIALVGIGPLKQQHIPNNGL